MIADSENVLESQISRKFRDAGYNNLILMSSLPVDLCDLSQTQSFFEENLPDCVVAVSKVNTAQSHLKGTSASQLHRELNSVLNLIYASYLYEVSKLINVVCDVDTVFPTSAARSAGTGRVGVARAGGSVGDLLSSVTASLCDRYRREYDCNFISAYFQLCTASRRVPEPELMLEQGMSDPAETCLFLLGQVSSPGVFSFRGQMPVSVA